MASAYQKDGRWYLRYRDESGRWRGKASSARTKAEARRLAEDVERRGERVRFGLEASIPEDGGGSLADLLTWWLGTYRKGAPSYEVERGAVKRHFEGSDLASLPLTAVNAGRIESFLQAKAAELAPQTLNHLRGYVSRAFKASPEAHTGLPEEGRGRAGHGRARPEVEAALRYCPLHRHA
jgi:hypothetical protein